jgi:hypothetical protein
MRPRLPPHACQLRQGQAFTGDTLHLLFRWLFITDSALKRLLASGPIIEGTIVLSTGFLPHQRRARCRCGAEVYACGVIGGCGTFGKDYGLLLATGDIRAL